MNTFQMKLCYCKFVCLLVISAGNRQGAEKYRNMRKCEPECIKAVSLCDVNIITTTKKQFIVVAWRDHQVSATL